MLEKIINSDVSSVTSHASVTGQRGGVLLIIYDQCCFRSPMMTATVSFQSAVLVSELMIKGFCLILHKNF